MVKLGATSNIIKNSALHLHKRKIIAQ
jgi:hypothetical protein